MHFSQKPTIKSIECVIDFFKNDNILVFLVRIKSEHSQIFRIWSSLMNYPCLMKGNVTFSGLKYLGLPDSVSMPWEINSPHFCFRCWLSLSRILSSRLLRRHPVMEAFAFGCLCSGPASLWLPSSHLDWIVCCQSFPARMS